MSKMTFGKLGRAALGGVGIFLLIGVLVMAINTLPQSTSSAYPPPEKDTPFVKPIETDTPEEVKPPIRPSQQLVSDESPFFNRNAGFER